MDSSASSPRSLAEATSSSPKANPIIRPDDRDGARTGAVVGKPRCLSILTTTSGSVRKAETTMGTGWPGKEHLGQASELTWSTRRSNCAQGVRRRDLPEGRASGSLGFGRGRLLGLCREHGLRLLCPWRRQWRRQLAP